MRDGSVQRLHAAPNEEGVPMFGVPTGPRAYNWRPTEPATLYWVEALDEGDPKKKVSHRDRVMLWDVTRGGAGQEILKLEHRYSGIGWIEGGMAFVTEYDRDRQRNRQWLLDAVPTRSAPRLVYELNTRDRYADPGSPITKDLPNGRSVILRNGDSIYLSGAGASAEGDRPFLDRMNLRTLEKQRLFQSEKGRYETVSELLADDASRLLIRSESAVEPPNYSILHNGQRRPVTVFKDPTPQIRNIYRQRVTYKRSDGVECSFTLYLPPGRKPGDGPLPTVLWAYPLEYTDPATAGQISGSLDRFTTIRGTSQLFLLMSGYAVLNDVTMPIVGDPETVNDKFVEQLVDSAKAAIDKAVEMGVTDRNRVASMGHSYGAFMTANLLAHSDLFKAGVARSGAYNRTLTPFGFQSERRTLWQAPEMYLKVSALHGREQDQRADPPDPRRRGQQLGHVPHPERASSSRRSRATAAPCAW
jgi:dipeptidyl aminopeptidase/acylaminoacyl peptidase